MSSEPGPYGDGNSPNAGRAEVTEGMAYAFEVIVSDAKYGLSHSLGFPAQTNRYLNDGERFRFWNNATQFIPIGLFFDLFDQTGIFPLEVSESDPTGIIDNAHGFPFEIQVQALNTPVIDDIDSFQDHLWQLFGAGSGSSLTNYSILFNSYGH